MMSLFKKDFLKETNPHLSLQLHVGTKILLSGETSSGPMISVALQRCLAVGRGGVLQKTGRTMKKERCVYIFKQHLKTSVRKLEKHLSQIVVLL